MAVLDIIEMPHPVLEMRAREVQDDEFGPELAKKLSDMAETMYHAPGVGLAAPQVADPRRFVVVDPGEGDIRGTRLRMMVNPKIVERSDDTIVWRETCLSVPGLEVDVTRNLRIRVEWQDPGTGAPREERFEEYEAVIIQHELDHLEGTVLLDRVSRFQRARWVKKQKKKKLEHREP
jgi:peptide deformylase